MIAKLIGSIITGLLLWYEIDKENSVLKQICTAGKDTNCNAILGSKGAKLFNWLNWSEVGFFYFSGGFLFLLSSANYNTSTFVLLVWLNLFALPYTIFSIYYQWKIVKQWCPLCLAVQALLIIESIISYFGYQANLIPQPLNPSIFLSALSSFTLPVFFWLFTKQVLVKAQHADVYKKELNRLKYNPQIFDALLPKQKLLTASADNLGITIGSPNAANTIIKVCNPYCGPCAKAHPVIDEIIENNPDVKVQIIFTADDNEKDIKSKPVTHLMALYEKDAANINKALDDWYGADEKNYEAFAEKYKLNGELKLQGIKLQAMHNGVKKQALKLHQPFLLMAINYPKYIRSKT